MIVVVVSALLTACGAPADALPLKSLSPLYVATSVFAPAEVDVTMHVPATTGAEQPLPPLIVTVPVGVPAPGAVTVTDQFTA
jgi:hypothetical protein